jgi:hypothetical protein
MLGRLARRLLVIELRVAIDRAQAGRIGACRPRSLRHAAPRARWRRRSSVGPHALAASPCGSRAHRRPAIGVPAHGLDRTAMRLTGSPAAGDRRSGSRARSLRHAAHGLAGGCLAARGMVAAPARQRPSTGSPAAVSLAASRFRASPTAGCIHAFTFWNVFGRLAPAQSGVFTIARRLSMLGVNLFSLANIV